MLIAIQVPGSCCQETVASHWPLPHHVTQSLDVTPRGCGAKQSVYSGSGKELGGVWTASTRETPAHLPHSSASSETFTVLALLMDS